MKFKLVEELNNEKKTYTYNGPYYVYGRYRENISLTTTASSLPQASNFIKHQIRKKLGVVNNTPIKIDSSKITVVEKPTKPKQEEPKPSGGWEQMRIKL